MPAAANSSVTVYKTAALVDSAVKSVGYTENSIISPAGHFMFKLPSGVYRIISNGEAYKNFINSIDS